MKAFEKIQMDTLRTIENITNYKSKYNLYSMAVKFHYDIDNVIKNFTEQSATYKAECDDNTKVIENAMKVAMDVIKKEVRVETPEDIKMSPFGCSTFTLKAEDREKSVWMGRNYDFRINTSAMLVYCQPEHAYKSVGFAALSNVGVLNPMLENENQKQVLCAPFICLDGMNEKGVSIAVLVVDGEPTCQYDSSKADIFTSLAIRLVLDRAATTEEAVKLLKKYNMIAIGGKDYHFYISDAKGDGRVVEYNYKDTDVREMVVTPSAAVTNFYIFDEEHYGHGYDRYITIHKVLDKAEYAKKHRNNNKPYTELKTFAWEALKGSSQAPIEGDPTSNTQWSVLFDNTAGLVEIVFRRNWEDKHEYSLQELEKKYSQRHKRETEKEV